MADWQSLDPEAAREAEKYENPIPSRELILLRLDERGAPATREQLIEEFGLDDEDKQEALRRRLRAMERDGQLVYTRRGAYAPVDKLDLIRGREAGHRDGFGFLIPGDGSDDLFLTPAQMRLVFDGDRVLARVAGYDRRGRREGAIVEILERAHGELVGRCYEEGGIGRVVAQPLPPRPGRGGRGARRLHGAGHGNPGGAAQLRHSPCLAGGCGTGSRPTEARGGRARQAEARRPAPLAVRHHRWRGRPGLR